MDPIDLRLLNDWQHGFPLESAPFAVIGDTLGRDAEDVLANYRRWQEEGVVSRIGAVVAPKRIGASTLAALAAPPDRLEAVAALVSAVPEVNHNYAREHDYNLWFVVTAASAERLDEVIRGIERETACPAIRLPLEEEYHIDLGFDLSGWGRGGHLAPARRGAGRILLEPVEQRLLSALQVGLPLAPHPYAALGREVGLSEAAVLECIRSWLGEDLIRRFGVVVRHHELGYRANAMCVWEVPDDRIDELGRMLAMEPGVTLCYRRGRVLPVWPYNLYCMIHGKTRPEALAIRERMAGRLGLDAWPHAVLFSTRRFKQQGARYALPGAGHA